MPSARNELKTLNEENAERVARHMAMAAQVIDDDPELAHEHAQAAMRHAGRVGVVRETLAITAYATGDFALALRELRTVRRITGRNDHAAMIVDSERGVGRPEKALEEGRAVNREDLPVEQRVELAIALSGARLDLGQTELALHELDIPEDDPDRAFGWSAGLFAARAAVLSDLGRDDEAAEWTRRAEVAGDAVASRLAEGDTVVIHEMYIESAADESEEQTGRDVDAVASDAASELHGAETGAAPHASAEAGPDADGAASAGADAARADAPTEGEAASSESSTLTATAADSTVPAEASAEAVDGAAASDDAAVAAASPENDTSGAAAPDDDAAAGASPEDDTAVVATPTGDASAHATSESDAVSAATPADDVAAATDKGDAADAVTPEGDAPAEETADGGASAEDVAAEDITPDDIVVDDQSIDEEVAELLAAAGIIDDEDGADENGKTS